MSGSKIKKLSKFIFVLTGMAIFSVGFFSSRHVGAQKSPTITLTPTPKIISASPSPTVSPTPAEDNEVIRIETEEVNLNVRVIDRNNRPVNNLTQNDFKVFEDNQPQTITSFSKAEVPTNYSLVVDNSGSMRLLIEKVIEAGKIIINTNRADDETSVVRFVSSDKIEVVQDFTADKTDLNDALDNLYIEGGPTAIIDAVYLAAQQVQEYEKSSNRNDKKRRALILVSDGEDRTSFYKEQQLFDLLREADVQIYVIGFTNELSKEGGFISKSPRGKAEDFLKRLAEVTGGKWYFPQSTNELSDIAKDIAGELRTQYLVSYMPTNDKKDGTLRSIKVIVDDGLNKQKRIAITRTGRSAVAEKNSIPALQKPQKINPKP